MNSVAALEFALRKIGDQRNRLAAQYRQHGDTATQARVEEYDAAMDTLESLKQHIADLARVGMDELGYIDDAE